MEQRREDPILASARMEALAVLVIWFIAFGWTIGYCWLYGYNLETPPALMLGIPQWVMLGVFLPWGLCSIVSVVISSFLTADADLGEDPEEKRGEAEAAREIDHV